MSAVRDLYIEKMAGEQAEKKPLGNVTTSLTLKSNHSAKLEPIEEVPHKEDTISPKHE